MWSCAVAVIVAFIAGGLCFKHPDTLRLYAGRARDWIVRTVKELKHGKRE